MEGLTRWRGASILLFVFSSNRLGLTPDDLFRQNRFHAMELEQFLKILVQEFDRWTALEPTSPAHRGMTATEFHQYRVGAQESIGLIACQAFMTAMPQCSMDDFKRAWDGVKSGVPLISLFPPMRVE